MTTYSEPVRTKDSDEVAVTYKYQLGVNGEYGSLSTWYLSVEELTLDYLESKVLGEVNFSMISVSSNQEKGNQLADEGIAIDVIPTRTGIKYIASGWGGDLRHWHETFSRKRAEEVVNKIKETYQAAIA